MRAIVDYLSAWINNQFRPLYDIYKNLSILFEKSNREIKKEHLHKKSKTMRIKQKNIKSMDWFLYDIGLRHERVKQSIFKFNTQRAINISVNVTNIGIIFYYSLGSF